MAVSCTSTTTTLPMASRQTPRKRHNRNPSSSRTPRAGFVASDYESDTPYISNAPVPDAAPAAHLQRTNTELNLCVLQRYLPSITSIYAVAAHAVVYTFSPEEGQWEKAGVEGTMFVCAQHHSHQPVSSELQINAGEKACIFVLNRRGLDNVVVDLAQVTALEAGEELMSLRLEDDDGRPRVMGLWINKDREDTREVVGALCSELWGKLKRTGAEAALGDSRESGSEESEGAAVQAMGRRLSLTDLFGRS